MFSRMKTCLYLHLRCLRQIIRETMSKRADLEKNIYLEICKNMCLHLDIKTYTELISPAVGSFVIAYFHVP